MIKLIYKAAKPYIYPNLARRITLEGSSSSAYTLSKSLKAEQYFKPGWYMVELKAKGAFESANLEFIFAGTHNLPLPVRVKKLMKRVIYLPKAATSVAVKLNVMGDGSLSLLRFVPIKESFAQARMLKRLSDHPLINREELFAKLNKKADARKTSFNQVVFEAYNRLFCKTNTDIYQQWIEDLELDLIEKFSSEASQTALSSDYVCFVDANYILHEGSKDLLIKHLAKDPNGILIYPDEDQIDEYGARSKPWFKTDWNYDLFLSQDYISNCFVCKKSWYIEHQALFDDLGVKQALAMLLPKVSSSRILHLPLVLAHQQIKGIAAPEKPLASERLTRLEKAVPNLAAIDSNQSHLNFSLSIPTPHPLVSLIIPTRNGLSILKPCVESILEKTTYKNFEILVLDNQSNDKDVIEWFKLIQADERVKVLAYDHPFNYSAINNYGAQQAQGSIIGLINNDVEVISENWLTEMVSHACREDIGCVGAKLYYSNGQIQHAGVILGLGHVAGHAHRFAERDSAGYYQRLQLVQNYSAVTGACLLVRRSVYEQVGGLNERDLPVAYNDVDFCLKVRAAGYRNLWTPHAELYHHESVSRGEDDTPEKKARFDKEVAYMRTTWAKELDNDPCYNPNLSRLREDFSLREFF